MAARRFAAIVNILGRDSRMMDAGVAILLGSLCILQVFTVQLPESYGADSSVYIKLAENVREHGRYEFNYKPHTVYPPAFPLLLAGVSILTGTSEYGLYIRLMPVFSTLALGVWYFGLRQIIGVPAAAAVCILAASAAPLFRLVTQSVNSDAPFFLFSALAFLCAIQLSTTNMDGARRWLFGTLLLATVTTVLMRSVGVAMGCALLVTGTLSRYLQHRHGSPVPRLWATAGLLGLGLFGAWTIWAKHAERVDYPGQHMESYASQLVMKDPHQPDLGRATTPELLLRVLTNLPVQVAHLTEIGTRIEYIDPNWRSPLVLLPLVMLGVGAAALCQTAQGLLLSSYVVFYLGIYSFWPFDEGARFMLPIAPAAFAVAVFGARTIAVSVYHQPLRAKWCLLAAVFFLAVTTRMPSPGAGKQHLLAAVVWPLAAAGTVVSLIVQKTSAIRGFVLLSAGRAKVLAARGGIFVFCLLLAVGLLQQATAARTNLNADPAQYRHFPAAHFANWLATAGGGAVMAQQSRILHRLSNRKLVNFPITANPDTILSAIRRGNVRFVMVTDPVPSEYFLPSEFERWQQVEARAPGAFSLVQRGPGYRVFEATLVQP